MHPSLKPFEQFIQQNFSGILSISPDDSLTPLTVANTFTGNEEFIFVAKCTPFVYEPLKGKGLNEKTQFEVKMYNEGTSLIFGFELEDVVFETEIVKENIPHFLSTLLHQEMLTLAVVDARTFKLIWVTNTINFRMIRFHYADFFKKYGIIV